jgi:hypothetical protein
MAASTSASTLDSLDQDTNNLPSLNNLIRQSVKRTHCLFSADDAFRYNDQSDRAYAIVLLDLKRHAETND